VRRAWTPELIRAEIRRLHRRGASLAWARAPVKLRKSAEHHFGGWRAAVEAAGVDYERVRLKTHRHDDAELLAWLRRTARARPRMTLRELRRDGRMTVLRQRFGSWQAAVAKAGVTGWPVTAGRRRWTRATVIAALRDRYGRGLTANGDAGLYAAAKRLFGSLPAAGAAAGVEVKVGRARSRRETIAALRRIEREHGAVSLARVEAAGFRPAVVRHFGRLTAACAELGLHGRFPERAREQAALDDRRRLIERLRGIARGLSRPVLSTDVPGRTFAAIKRRFGTFAAARSAAGLPAPVLPRKWDRARVLEELRREARRRTRLTEPALIKAGRKDLVHAIHAHVGSIMRARRLAGVAEPAPLPRRKGFVKEWDDTRVIQEIRDRARAGESLAPSRCPSSLVRAASRYLESWRGAIEAAGFDYNAVVLHRPFDDGELLAALRQLAADRPAMTVTALNELPIATSLYRLYGGPENAARRAGLPASWPVRVHHRMMSRRQVHAALRARLAHGKSLVRADVTADDPRLAAAIVRLYPEWTESLARLGFPRAARRREGPAPRA
jgi:hypothetical protein